MLLAPREKPGHLKYPCLALMRAAFLLPPCGAQNRTQVIAQSGNIFACCAEPSCQTMGCAFLVMPPHTWQERIIRATGRCECSSTTCYLPLHLRGMRLVLVMVTTHFITFCYIFVYLPCVCICVCSHLPGVCLIVTTAAVPHQHYNLVSLAFKVERRPEVF